MTLLFYFRYFLFLRPGSYYFDIPGWDWNRQQDVTEFYIRLTDVISDEDLLLFGQIHIFIPIIEGFPNEEGF